MARSKRILLREEFAALRVQVKAKIPYTKHLYLRPHVGSEQEDVQPLRALFIAGLPLCVATDDLLQLFSIFGNVATLALHPTKVSGILVYDQEAACAKALAAAKDDVAVELTPSLSDDARGLKAWLQTHKSSFPGNQALQQRLDDWMEDFDAREARKRAAAEDGADGDGWTVVKRHKHRVTYEEAQHVVTAQTWQLVLRRVKECSFTERVLHQRAGSTAASRQWPLEASNEGSGTNTSVAGIIDTKRNSIEMVSVSDHNAQGRQTNSDGEGISMGAVSAAVATAAGKEADERRQLLPHFYRFQRREKRRDELLELREQFESDKKRIQELKAARKFKPL